MVKINFKTIDRRQFSVEIGLDKTVRDLLAVLASDHNVAPGAKLAYVGKVLKPDETLQSYGLGEGKTVIVATKPPSKTAAPAKPVAATPKPAAAPAVTPATPATPANTQPSGAAPDAPAKKDKATADAEGDENPNDVSMEETASSVMTESTTAMMTPNNPQFDETVTMLCQMTGASMDKVQRALAAAYNNPDRAAELLFSGAPLPSREQIEQAQRPQVQAGAAGTGSSQNPYNERNLTQSQQAALQVLSTPQFAMLKNAVQENPAALEPLLEQLGAEQPDLLRLLNDNQDLMLMFLNSPAEANQGAIKVTPEEKAAIERLQAMGFARDLAIQAYFACDKDENAALNFLYMNRDYE